MTRKTEGVLLLLDTSWLPFQHRLCKDGLLLFHSGRDGGYVQRLVEPDFSAESHEVEVDVAVHSYRPAAVQVNGHALSEGKWEVHCEPLFVQQELPSGMSFMLNVHPSFFRV